MVNHVNEGEYGRPHHRGSDRVSARIEEVPDQPARGRPHTLSFANALRSCANPTTSWSAKCATWRRSASRCRRDGSPRVRYATYELRGQDHRPRDRRLPAAEKDWCGRCSPSWSAISRRCKTKDQQGRRGARDHDRHASDPKPIRENKANADVLRDPDQPRLACDLDQCLVEMVRRNQASMAKLASALSTRTCRR